MVYTVYGQELGHGHDCLKYLIDPGDQPGLRRPNWYPAGWFTLVENSIPSSWIFGYNNQPESHQAWAIWGYPELVTQPTHIASLIEREEQAILIFFERAGEIDCEQDREAKDK